MVYSFYLHIDKDLVGMHTYSIPLAELPKVFNPTTCQCEGGGKYFFNFDKVLCPISFTKVQLRSILQAFLTRVLWCILVSSSYMSIISMEASNKLVLAHQLQKIPAGFLLHPLLHHLNTFAMTSIAPYIVSRQKPHYKLIV